MFEVEPGPVRLYDFPYPDTTQLAITYELNRDLQIIRRKVYGLLDFLGDLGGLAGALRGLFTVVVLIFQYKVVLNYVSNHTFLIRDGDELNNGAGQIQQDQEDGSSNRLTLKRIPVGFFGGVWLSLQRIFAFCTCCHSNRDKFSHAADRFVKEELKIVGWVQHMRCQKLAMKKLFTEAQWQEIELEAKFRTLAIDPETNKVICISDAQQQEDKLQKDDHSRNSDVTKLENFAFNSSAMSLLEKEKSPDKTGLGKEAKKKMTSTNDHITAPIPDNSFVKTTKADVVYDSADKSITADRRNDVQVKNNKLPSIDHATINPTDKVSIDIELEAMGQANVTAVNEALDSARNDLDAVEEELKRNGD